MYTVGMYIYTYIHICMYMYIFAYTYIYIFIINIYVYLHSCIIYIYTCIRIYINICMYTYKCMFCIYIPCTYVYIYAYISIGVYICFNEIYISMQEAHVSARYTYRNPHIRPISYLIRVARSFRICLQQHFHHLWPGLVCQREMQRQTASRKHPVKRLCKRSQRATSARHTQADMGTVAPMHVTGDTSMFI